MKRIVTGALLAASVLLPALLAVAAPAEAGVVAVSLPTAAGISGPTLTFSGTVRLRVATAGPRTASLWFQYSDAVGLTQVGTARSRQPGFLVVTATLDTRRIEPGINRVLVRDDADGATRAIALDLRRVSRVAITHAEYRSDGTVALAVRLRHYDARLGRFAPSRLSPVRLEEKVFGVWTPIGDVTTNASGLAGTVVSAGPGEHSYRAVRPIGATVLAATSKTIRTGRTTGAMIVP